MSVTIKDYPDAVQAAILALGDREIGAEPGYGPVTAVEHYCGKDESTGQTVRKDLLHELWADVAAAGGDPSLRYGCTAHPWRGRLGQENFKLLCYLAECAGIEFNAAEGSFLNALNPSYLGRAAVGNITGSAADRSDTMTAHRRKLAADR